MSQRTLALTQDTPSSGGTEKGDSVIAANDFAGVSGAHTHLDLCLSLFRCLELHRSPSHACVCWVGR